MNSGKELQQNYEFILQQIEKSKKIDLQQNSVQLIAVSKNQSVNSIAMLYNIGQQDFAENYLSEAINKINELKTIPDIIWHYIGKIQSRKIKDIAQHFDWVHTVENTQHAEKLNFYAKQFNKKLNILLQINIDNDPNKSGISFDDQVIPTIKQIINHDYSHLNICGLMGMLKQDNTHFETQYSSFKQLDNLLTNLNQRLGLQLNVLSIGMSGDYQAAIAASSASMTMIRIGSSLFK